MLSLIVSLGVLSLSFDGGATSAFATNFAQAYSNFGSVSVTQLSPTRATADATYTNAQASCHYDAVFDGTDLTITATWSQGSTATNAPPTLRFSCAPVSDSTELGTLRQGGIPVSDWYPGFDSPVGCVYTDNGAVALSMYMPSEQAAASRYLFTREGELTGLVSAKTS